MNVRPYIDLLLVAILAIPVLALGAPALGYLVGGAAWILVRVASIVAERRLADEQDVRRRIGLGVFYGMVRVWLLAGTIVALGIAASRPDGLTAALTIFGAFSVYFAGSAIAHVTRKRTA